MIAAFYLVTLVSAERDFYDILNLKHDCLVKEIERSYQKLSRKYHPDKNKNNKDPKIAEKYNDIIDAYSALRDPLKRRVYDLYGEDGLHLYEAPRKDFDPSSLSKTEGDLSAIVRNVGPTITYDFPVDLEDFYTGKKYQLEVSRRGMCRCPFAGYLCDKCHGRPTIRENFTLNLFLERGFEEGTTITFKNQGDTSVINGPGNIDIRFVSKKHKLFTRNGPDLHITVDVTLKEALLGFKREFNHIDGTKLTIESNELIQMGDTIKIKGKGLPKYLYPGEYGDVIVHTNIQWPNNLTKDQKSQVVNILNLNE